MEPSLESTAAKMQDQWRPIPLRALSSKANSEHLRFGTRGECLRIRFLSCLSSQHNEARTVSRLKNGTLEWTTQLRHRDHEETPPAKTPLFSPTQVLPIVRKDGSKIRAAFFFEFLPSPATSDAGAFLCTRSRLAHNQPLSSIR